MLTTVLLTAAAALPQDRAYGPSDVDQLPLAVTELRLESRTLSITLPLVEVPAGGMARTEIYRAVIPEELRASAFRVDVVSEDGSLLPADRLHHFNLTDPDRRELFTGLPLHIMAASKETGEPSVPWFLLGMPLAPGDRYLAAAMLANPESRPIRMQPRLVFTVRRPGRLFPLFDAYPWVMDVKFPNGGDGGRKDFDLPPGRSSHSWESRPAIPGTILGLGGHVHDYATAVELADVTTGELIWRGVPETGPDGRVTHLEPGRLYRWYRLGVRIDPSHTYRVTVHYDNPTGQVLRFGGMGAVAGLFRPEPGHPWPRVDPTDPVYRIDIDNLLRNMAGLEMGHGEDPAGGHQHQHGTPSPSPDS